jgi:hypothetical protein
MTQDAQTPDTPVTDAQIKAHIASLATRTVEHVMFNPVTREIMSVAADEVARLDTEALAFAQGDKPDIVPPTSTTCAPSGWARRRSKPRARCPRRCPARRSTSSSTVWSRRSWTLRTRSSTCT